MYELDKIVILQYNVFACKRLCYFFTYNFQCTLKYQLNFLGAVSPIPESEEEFYT